MLLPAVNLISSRVESGRFMTGPQQCNARSSWRLDKGSRPVLLKPEQCNTCEVRRVSFPGRRSETHLLLSVATFPLLRILRSIKNYIDRRFGPKKFKSTRLILASCNHLFPALVKNKIDACYL